MQLLQTLTGLSADGTVEAGEFAQNLRRNYVGDKAAEDLDDIGIKEQKNHDADHDPSDRTTGDREDLATE